jgi:hypothetical protein
MRKVSVIIIIIIIIIIIHANRPDIIATDRVNKCTYLADIAVPGTINLKKHTEKKSINTLNWQMESEEYGTRRKLR